MAGRGPAPSGRQPKGKKAVIRESVKSDGKMGGFALPKGVLGDQKVVDANGVETMEPIEWHPMTVKWWAAWRKSPQATKMMTEPDWYFLLDAALMHHQMWVTKRFDLAGEVRQRVAKFGATPEDRARLRMEVEVPELNSVGSVPAANTNPNVSNITSRRAEMIRQETERKAAEEAAAAAATDDAEEVV